MPKIISQAVQQEIVSLYVTEKKSQLEIAKTLGLSRGTVRSYLLKSGATIEQRPEPWDRNLSEDARDKIVELYLSGASSPTNLARDFGLNGPWAVHAIVKQRGITAHSPRRGRAALPDGTTRINDRGYVIEKVSPTWKFFGSMRGQGHAQAWVSQHRKVMADLLDRPLLATEQVHHIDGNRANNQPENLQIMSGNHCSGVRLTCYTCGSTNIKTEQLA